MPNNDKPLIHAQGRLFDNEPEESVPKPKRAKRARATYPLKLTQNQRKTLLGTYLTRNLKQQIEQAGEGSQIVAVTLEQLRFIARNVGRSALYSRRDEKKRLMTVIETLDNLFEQILRVKRPQPPHRPTKAQRVPFAPRLTVARPILF